jgi:homeobox-leucine zipper protein
VAFLVCRCREKQRKEASQLQSVNRKLSAMNKLLMEENERLQKQVSQLVNENGFMRQQLHIVSPIIVHFHSLLWFFFFAN